MTRSSSVGWRLMPHANERELQDSRLVHMAFVLAPSPLFRPPGVVWGRLAITWSKLSSSSVLIDVLWNIMNIRSCFVVSSPERESSPSNYAHVGSEIGFGADLTRRVSRIANTPRTVQRSIQRRVNAIEIEPLNFLGKSASAQTNRSTCLVEGLYSQYYPDGRSGCLITSQSA
ncbi:hypothetical protein SCHPADRAFT_436560 [Schizopora paradoxa]|uniref:Uncharacterized protein n=1 Tax=Schizopora paradoxa TaxID=27342 RepID=A0A0H2S585_9AGAM|nr:hypothetical protein SCHPADRAFT_436560 [Schizopora paradoxa]